MEVVAQDPSTIETIADVAQVVIGIAAVVSIWIGLSSLREVRRERIQRVRPWLAFNHGGQAVSCEDAQASGLPGFNPAFIHELVGTRARDVRKPTSQWGRLRNHGGGVALETEIVFVTAHATVGNETFRIQADKLSDFPYDLRLNRLPASPSHIHPGEGAHFFRLPTPMFEREGNRQVIKGVVIIKCRDILDRKHVRYQRFRAGVEKGKGINGVLMTFSDELTQEEARDDLGDLAAEVPELEKGDGESALAEFVRRIAIPSGLPRL